MLNNIMNSQKPNNYVRRRIDCFDQVVEDLENGTLVVSIPRGVLEWEGFQTVLTGYIRYNCGHGGFYDEDIHSLIMDFYGDRLYKIYEENYK
jgi:hypothetical protein